MVERLGTRLKEARCLRLLLPLGEGDVGCLLHAVLGRESANAVELGRMEARALDVGELKNLGRDLKYCRIPKRLASGG
eukprot:6212377-Pleurochrysis_carterae.AAC.1